MVEPRGLRLVHENRSKMDQGRQSTSGKASLTGTTGLPRMHAQMLAIFEKHPHRPQANVGRLARLSRWSCGIHLLVARIDSPQACHESQQYLVMVRPAGGHDAVAHQVTA